MGKGGGEKGGRLCIGNWQGKKFMMLEQRKDCLLESTPY